MTAFVKYNALILITCWIFSCRKSHFVYGSKPKCKGEALKPEEFSGKEYVGFVRDICVSMVARNIYNKSGYLVPKLCEQLANMRTKTCFIKCFKWNRSSPRNKGEVENEMAMAEALMEDLNTVVSSDVSISYDTENSIPECIDEAVQLLVSSGAALENSKLIQLLEKLRRRFGPRSDPKENEDVVTAVKEFIKNYEGENNVKISTYDIENNVVKAAFMSGVMRLKFKYEKNGDTKSGAVILKIPSLAPLNPKNIVFEREAYFYETLLPALYQLGKCEPFAPKLYAVTPTKALVLEDLSVEGYMKIEPTQFNLNLGQIALNVLAKYHALSYVYLQNLKKDDSNTSLIESFQPSINKEEEEKRFDALCKAVKPHLKKPLYQKIVKAKNEILVNIATTNNKDDNRMTVIIHGDFHLRNILFKCDSQEEACYAKLIDWQISKKGSPLIDLIEFFVLDIYGRAFEANEDSLVNSYLDTLNQNLSSLSTNRVYNRSDLDSDMTLWKYHYFRLLAIMASGMMELPSQATKAYAENIAVWLMYLDKKGWIK